MAKLADSVRREWDSLRPDDVVYLLAVNPAELPQKLTNGHSAPRIPQDSLGILTLRTAEVVQILDENGRPIREPVGDQVNGYGRRPRIRRLIVNLDPAAFKADSDLKVKGRPDVYESINVVVRRNQRENNFKKQLETIQSLALSDVPVPAWLQDVFLGIGDPTSASHTRLTNQLEAVNFQDTFCDWNHLVESFPHMV